MIHCGIRVTFKYGEYTNLLKQCGYTYASKSETKYETYIDKNNTFKKRMTSFYEEYKNEKNWIILIYFFKIDRVAIDICYISADA